MTPNDSITLTLRSLCLAITANKSIERGGSGLTAHPAENSSQLREPGQSVYMGRRPIPGCGQGH